MEKIIRESQFESYQSKIGGAIKKAKTTTFASIRWLEQKDYKQH